MVDTIKSPYRILVLAENMDIQISSSSKCVSKMINAMSISPEFEIEVVYPEMYGNEHSWLKDVKVHYLPTFDITIEDGISVLDRFTTQWKGFARFEKYRIGLWRTKVTELLKIDKFDAIMLLASGSEFYTHHAVAQMNLSVSIIAYYHDPYPLLYYPSTYRNTSGKRVQLMKAKSLQLVLSKAANFFPSQLLADSYGEYYKISESSIYIAPHVNMELSDLYEYGADKVFLLSDHDFNITHAGSLHSSRNPSTLISAFKLLVEKFPEEKNFRLNLVGGKGSFGKEIDELLNLYAKEVRFFDRVGYKESLDILGQSQVNVILEANDDFSPFLPGKFPDYIQADRPILHIGPKKSEVLRILGSDYPYQVRHGEVDKLLEIMSSLYLKWKDKEQVRLSKKDIENYLSPEYFRQQVINSLQDS